MTKIQCMIMAILSVLIFITPPAYSSVRYESYDGAPVNINVEVGRTTEVVFPELIAELLKSEEKGSIDLEVKDRSLYVLPKKESNSDLFVRTVSGQNVPINLIFGAYHDIRVQVSYVKSDNPSKRSTVSTNPTISIITALLKGEDIVGASLDDTRRKIYENKYLRLTLVKKFELSYCFAFVVEAENLIQRSLVLPLQHIGLPNLKAISSDHDVLTAAGKEGDKTNVYMVIGK